MVTNHALALTRSELVRHVVFDECEHLHDVAAGTWSRRTTVEALRGLLDRLEGSVLDRLDRELAPLSAAARDLEQARGARRRAARALEALEREARRFEDWREESRGEVEPEDEHALFRRWVEGAEGGGLVRARVELVAACGELEETLGLLGASIEPLGLRGTGRLRRSLDLARAEVAEQVEALAAWLPTDGGAPRLGQAFFHDVQRDARGALALVARVLSPPDVLAEHVYPSLATGVFLSATTRLAGGFDASLGFLGLDRVADRAVRTASAPEGFDYGRVLVGVPRDAPHPSDKPAALEYAAQVIDWLAERTRGRILALFTNADDVRRVGEALRPAFRERRMDLWYQGMDEAQKEELAERFRSRVDSVLLGVDTFWYGADFPGETLEVLVIARLPYGVPDRFHHAQRAALGPGEHRRRIYLPRALAKFRQGFGRLMRRASDRGCVLVLDPRLMEARHRPFLRELPLERGGTPGARLVRGDGELVLRETLAHLGLLEDLRRRGLSPSFGSVAAS